MSSVLVSTLVSSGVCWYSSPNLDRGSSVVRVSVVDMNGHPLSWAWLWCRVEVRGIIPSLLNIGVLGSDASHARRFLLAAVFSSLMLFKVLFRLSSSVEVMSFLWFVSMSEMSSFACWVSSWILLMYSPWMCYCMGFLIEDVISARHLLVVVILSLILRLRSGRSYLWLPSFSW